MPTKLATARRAADYARAEEARKKQVGRDLLLKRGVALEGARLIALGAARLSTADEITSREAAR